MMFTQANQTGDGARLEDYLRAVKERKLAVLVCLALGLALATAYVNTRTNTYTGEATVALGPTPVGSPNANLVNPNLEKEREIMLSNEVSSAVVENLELDDDPRELLEFAEVEFRPLSDVMTVSYTNTNAEVAADYANAFASAYVAQREGEALGFYEAQIAEAESNIEQIEDTISELDGVISELQEEQSTVVADFPEADERTIALSRINADLSVNRTSRGVLSSQLNTESARLRAINSTLASRTASAEVLRTAEPSPTPNGLSGRLIQIGGALLGLIAGIVTAFLLERLDTTTRDESDVALALGENVIGSVPSLGLAARGAKALVMLTTGGRARQSAARESFRRLRSAVQFMRSADSIRSIIITSASPAEGKSVVAANLAVALAQAGQSVALISADLRRPTQEERFGITGSNPGLSEFLGADVNLELDEIPGVKNLWLARAGATPANPGELLGSSRMQGLVDDLTEQVDVVLIDTPPLLSTADATAVGQFVDGVIVVVDSRRTDASDLLQVRADLERSGARLLGAVLNKTRFNRGSLLRRNRYAYYTSERKRSSQPEIRPAAIAAQEDETEKVTAR